MDPISDDQQDHRDRERRQEDERVHHPTDDRSVVEDVAHAEQAGADTREDRDDHRRADERAEQLSRSPDPVAPRQQESEEDEPDAQLVPEIDHGEIPDLAQPVGAFEEADAEHPSLESRHQKREALVVATEPSAEGESDPGESYAQHEDADNDGGDARIELDFEERREQDGR